MVEHVSDRYGELSMPITENHQENESGAQIATDLYRLIYCSRNCISGTQAKTIDEITAILDASRNNNAACGISGALMFNSGIFAQVLEGPRSAIESAFERIQRDARHNEVNILVFEAVNHRVFPFWSMAFIGRSHRSRNLLSDNAFATSIEERRSEAELILALLRQIALEEEKAL